MKTILTGPGGIVVTAYRTPALMRDGQSIEEALFSYSETVGQALPYSSVIVMDGPCRIMVLSAAGVCHRMTESEALAS